MHNCLFKQEKTASFRPRTRFILFKDDFYSSLRHRSSQFCFFFYSKGSLIIFPLVFFSFPRNEFMTQLFDQYSPTIDYKRMFQFSPNNLISTFVCVAAVFLFFPTLSSEPVCAIRILNGKKQKHDVFFNFLLLFFCCFCGLCKK